jgi:hypothetical protein
VRTRELIGRTAFDRTGEPIGFVVDLVAEPGEDGVPRVVGVVVTRGLHGRLLGYERAEQTGPWLVERLARLLRRGTRTVEWSEVRIGSPD